MKEIKFRAYDLYDKKIYKVRDIVFYNEVDNNGMLGEVFYEGEENKGSRYFGEGEKAECILMQYTGLKDENNKEIYEGDVVRNNDGDILRVKYSTTNGYYVVKNNNIIELLSDYSFKGEIIGLEVIGNIYKNPDLINNK